MGLVYCEKDENQFLEGFQKLDRNKLNRLMITWTKNKQKNNEKKKTTEVIFTDSSLKLVCLLPSETNPELKMIDDGSDKNETIAKQFPLCKYLSVSFSAQYKAITKCRYLVYQGSSYFLNRFEILNLFYETLSVLQTSTSLSKLEKRKKSWFSSSFLAMQDLNWSESCTEEFRRQWSSTGFNFSLARCTVAQPWSWLFSKFSIVNKPW